MVPRTTDEIRPWFLYLGFGRRTTKRLTLLPLIPGWPWLASTAKRKPLVGQLRGGQPAPDQGISGLAPLAVLTQLHLSPQGSGYHSRS
jgi:hypothetical protein